MVLGMVTNSVSDFVPTPAGGLFLHLKERTAPNPEKFEKDKRLLEAQLLEQDREAIFQDWENSLMRGEQVEYKRKARPVPQEQPAEEPEPAPAPAS